MDGDWIDSPNCVKKEFLNYFKDRFAKPYYSWPCFQKDFPWVLLDDQSDILDVNVTREEIKRVVLDFQSDKALGPDSFVLIFFFFKF